MGTWTKIKSYWKALFGKLPALPEKLPEKLPACSDCHWYTYDKSGGLIDYNRHRCGFPDKGRELGEHDLVLGKFLYKRRYDYSLCYLQRECDKDHVVSLNCCGPAGRWFAASEEHEDQLDIAEAARLLKEGHEAVSLDDAMKELGLD